MAKPTFPRGIHPAPRKERSQEKAIRDIPLPETLMVPLAQHLGKPAKLLKSRGDTVEIGERIGEAQGFISAHVHAPAAGKIKKIHDLPLPGGRMGQYAEITVDPEATAAQEAERFRTVQPDPAEITPEKTAETLKEAGIVGMGGATFPAHVKFSPPPDKPIDTLIINGAECEPYLTCDYRMMVEKSAGILQAVQILVQALGFKQVIFGIEDNKPGALKAVRKAAREFPGLPLRAEAVKTKYPQGAEKMLILALTGRKVPPGKLPLDAGVIVSNVQTLFAVYEAFYRNKPLIDRVLTVSGPGIAEPANLRAPVGTQLPQLLEQTGGMAGESDKLIAGGPMMGVALPSLDYSVMKGSSGFLFLREGKIPAEGACLNCGMCLRVCPMHLAPLRIAARARIEDFEGAKDADAAACVECGSCAYACPAQIRLVAWIRYAKSEIRQRQL